MALVTFTLMPYRAHPLVSGLLSLPLGDTKSMAAIYAAQVEEQATKRSIQVSVVNLIVYLQSVISVCRTRPRACWFGFCSCHHGRFLGPTAAKSILANSNRNAGEVSFSR